MPIEKPKAFTVVAGWGFPLHVVNALDHQRWAEQMDRELKEAHKTMNEARDLIVAGMEIRAASTLSKALIEYDLARYKGAAR